MSKQPWDTTDNDRHSAHAHKLYAILKRLNVAFGACIVTTGVGGVVMLNGNGPAWVLVGLGVMLSSLLVMVGLFAWCLMLLRAAKKIPTREEREAQAKSEGR